MINTITSEDEHENSLQNEKDSVLVNLKDEKNVIFEGEKVKFSENEFANIQEALAYLKKQENILLQKNREKNENVVKEVSEILDNVQTKGFLDEYSSGKFFHEKKTIQNIKDFLSNYEGDLSNFMNEVVSEWKKRLQPYVGRGNAHQDFVARWHINTDTFNKLEGEDLINALKKEANNIDKLHKATASNLMDQDLGTASFIYYVFDEIYKKYQKKQDPFK